MATKISGKFQFAIDRGGTFTDVFARCPNGQVRVMKLLSVDPKNYKDAPVGEIIDKCNDLCAKDAFNIPNRRREFGGFWRVKPGKKLPGVTRSMPPTLNGFEWALQSQQMLS